MPYLQLCNEYDRKTRIGFQRHQVVPGLSSAVTHKCFGEKVIRPPIAARVSVESALQLCPTRATPPRPEVQGEVLAAVPRLRPGTIGSVLELFDSHHISVGTALGENLRVWPPSWSAGKWERHEGHLYPKRVSLSCSPQYDVTKRGTYPLRFLASLRCT